MSNTTESISAKLRRWADECEESSQFSQPSTFARRDLDIYGSNVSEMNCRMFRRIADEVDAELESAMDSMRYKSLIPLDQVVGEIANGSDEYDELKAAIDRYYLPRPLFDDGEPAQFGDMFVRDFGRDAKIDSLSYTKGNSDYVNVNGYERHDFAHRLKRPNPQVLDADGVPIEVGDKVWMLPGKHCETFPLYGYKPGVEYTVSENESASHKENGRICITGGDCTCGYPMPEQVTHREPDTQERIDEDATMPPREYYAKHIGHYVGLKDDEEVWTAVTAHLLRRQRELDGRAA